MYLNTVDERGIVRKLVMGWMLAVSALLSGCGYNDLQANDEQIKAGWAEVVNQYQWRADLVPNLVNTVKGYAVHEKDTLEAITRARASATSMQVSPAVLNDPAALAKFQAAQGALSGALSRLLAVALAAARRGGGSHANHAPHSSPADHPQAGQQVFSGT